MSLRHRIGRLERKRSESRIEDPNVSEMSKELRAEERRRDATRMASLNLARRMWVRAGQPERAAAITLDNLAEQMEPALNALGLRYRLALRIAAARLLQRERARQEAEGDRDQPEASQQRENAPGPG